MVRLLQGLSVGGEYGAVATYMSEIALKGQRGFYASFQYVTLSGGQLLASLLGVIMLAFMTEQQLMDGGWRIPFVIGGIAAIISLLARSKLEETLSHEDSDKKNRVHCASYLKALVYLFTGGGLYLGRFFNFYVLTVYSKPISPAWVLKAELLAT